MRNLHEHKNDCQQCKHGLGLCLTGIAILREYIRPTELNPDEHLGNKRGNARDAHTEQTRRDKT